MTVPAQPLMIFLGALSLLLGLFLLLTGAGIVKHSRLKALRNNKAVVAGGVFVLLAAPLLFPGIIQTVVAPTPTAPALPTPSSTREILFSDNFDSTKYNWKTGSSDSERVEQSSEIINGKLAFAANYKASNTTAWVEVPDFSAKDFGLGFNATLTEASGDKPFSVSIAGRYKDADNFYLIRFSQSNRFSVQVKKDGDWKTVLAWTQVEGITQDVLATGKNRRLDVFFQDKFIMLFINGLEVFKISDSTLNEAGKILIGIDSAEANQTIKVDFDNVVIVNK